MAYAAYPHALESTAESGFINGTRVTWRRESLNERLVRFCLDIEQPVPLIKALTENFMYLTAVRLGARKVRIMYDASAINTYLPPIPNPFLLRRELALISER